jgi:hypothetical protein
VLPVRDHGHRPDRTRGRCARSRCRLAMHSYADWSTACWVEPGIAGPPTTRRPLAPRTPTRLIETSGRRCGLAGMAVSRVVALRGPGGLALDPPADPCWAWLSNDVSARRGLAVAWLKRGANAGKVLELGI